MSFLPIATVSAPCAGSAQATVILLPGAFMNAPQLISMGFARARDARRAAIDLVILDADPARRAPQAIDRALSEVVAQTAHGAARRQIWIAGISLGGLLAIDHVAQHPGTVHGLCLIAPYPGTRPTLLQLAEADDANADRRTPSAIGDDPEGRAWRWLRDRPERLPVYLGYGVDDRFAAGIGQMAQYLAPDDLDAVPGAHDWPVWLALWERFLDRACFGRHTTGRAA